ncbi:iron-containing alcohol dehydrogenase [Escherichia coli]|uniref:iron-containing alcohol dehydrogenase n=1 Tax=Escherichia coli TaxID=562 RepID=UPI000FFBDF63|nr:iron-containing alcohol dehydrogenase [Escherichia coli]RXA34526.1 iron-containing alcohol dehydrogenase [Escherichia coli]
MATSSLFIPSGNDFVADSLNDEMNYMGAKGYPRALVVHDDTLSTLGMGGCVPQDIEKR